MTATVAASPTQTTPSPQIKLPHFDLGQFFHALHPLVHLWWVAALALVVGAARRIPDYRRRALLHRAGMADIDRLDGQSFELKLATVFKRRGYSVEVVGRTSGDYGADLILSRGGHRTAVQAKRWARNVGIDAVNQVVGARGYYRTDDAMVVTTSSFTQAARKQAERNRVTLWAREELAQALVAAEPPVRSVPPVSARGAVEDAAHCARCGKAVSEKVRDYCLTYPRRFAGLVYCFEHQRAL